MYRHKKRFFPMWSLEEDPGRMLKHQLVYRRDILKNHGIDIETYIRYYVIINSTKVDSKHHFHGVSNNVIYYATGLEDDNKRVMKIASTKNKQMTLEYEAYVQNKLKKARIVDDILIEKHLKSGNNKVSILIMTGSFDTIVTDLRERRLKRNELEQIFSWVIRIFNVLSEYNITHGDLHWGNIYTDHDDTQYPLQYKPMLIDFGKASHGSSNIPLETMQLLRSLRSKKFNMHPYNIEFLEKKLVKFYEENFGEIPKNHTYDEIYRTMDYEYQTNVLIPRREAYMKSYKYERYTPLRIKDYWPYRCYSIKKLVEFN